jgi:hypothetical protein
MSSTEVAEARLVLAEAYLQEAVYRSREVQADPLAGGLGVSAGCGLGAEAAVELAHTEKAASLFEDLFPGSMDARRFGHLRAVTAEWVARQDALDRKRNHFLRDFRREHGAERTAYSADEARAFDQGLEAVNEEERRARRAAARRLIDSPLGSPDSVG